jgi:hypothetical protein
MVAPASLFTNALAATNTLSGPTSSAVTMANTGTVDSYNSPLTTAWNSATTYLAGTVVRSGSTLYRCIATSTNNAPPNATYWAASTLPLGFSAVIAAGVTPNNNGANAIVFSNSFVVGGYLAAPASTTSPYNPRISYVTGTGVNLKNANDR